MKRSHIAVLVPCYNEAATVAKVVKDYREALPGADVYVYDNNSTDHTDELARAAGAVVRYEYRQGKGNVIRSMFRDIDADCYLMIDGDDTYPAENAREMCELVLSGRADMVIGDRLSSTYFEQNKRPFHNFGNVLVRKCINFFWGRKRKQRIVDVMTGYRAFSPIFVKSFPILSEGFEIETEMTVHALDKNFLIRSVPVAYRDRPAGSASKLNTYRDGFKVMMTIFNLFRNYRPFAFFGSLALFLFVLAAVFFVPVLIDYFETGLVPRFPTLITCAAAATSSLLSFFCGCILDAHVVSNRKDAEIQITMMSMTLRRQGWQSPRIVLPQKKEDGPVQKPEGSLPTGPEEGPAEKEAEKE